MFKLIKLLKMRRIKFKQIAEEWLETKKINVKESTYCNYRYTMNRYIIPKFGNMSTKQLEKYNFNEFVDELMKELSTSSIRDILCVLKGILNYANDEYECKFKIQKIVSPKSKRKNLKIMSRREKSRLENYCIKEKSLKALGIVICLNTGMRIGEICALKWEEINLERRIIYVKYTLQRIYDDNTKKTKVVIDVPKTRNSIREIPISNKLYELLKELKKNHNPDDYFLTGECEKYVEPRSYQSFFSGVLKKCKIKHYKFHCLRHYFATECIAVGMDVKTLSIILGHSSVDITLNRYVHSDFSRQKKFLEKI